MNLKRLKELEAAATPGPWEWDWEDDPTGNGETTVRRLRKANMTIAIEDYLYSRREDLELLAEMRNQLPAMLDLMARARALCELIAGDKFYVEAYRDEIREGANKLLKEIEKHNE